MTGANDASSPMDEYILGGGSFNAWQIEDYVVVQKGEFKVTDSNFEKAIELAFLAAHPPF